MLTSTLSLSWSSLISATWPEKSANGPFLDPHRLAHLVLEAGPAALGRCLAALDLDLEDALDLSPRQGRRLGAGADEPGDAGGVADDRPAVVVELAPAQQVAGEHLLLDDDLLAVLELGDVLHRDDDLVDAVLHAHRDRAAVEVRLHLVLIAGVGVDDVPATGLVVGADDERLVVLVVVLVVDSSTSRVRLGTAASATPASTASSAQLRRLAGVRGHRVGGRRPTLGSVVAGSSPRGGSGSVVGHSHTDQGLNSQRTPLAKA